VLQSTFVLLVISPVQVFVISVTNANTVVCNVYLFCLLCRIRNADSEVAYSYYSTL